MLIICFVYVMIASRVPLKVKRGGVVNQLEVSVLLCVFKVPMLTVGQVINRKKVKSVALINSFTWQQENRFP